MPGKAGDDCSGSGAVRTCQEGSCSSPLMSVAFMFGEGAGIPQCLLTGWELHVSFEKSFSGQELKRGLLAPVSRAGGCCGLRALCSVCPRDQRNTQTPRC